MPFWGGLNGDDYPGFDDEPDYSEESYQKFNSDRLYYHNLLAFKVGETKLIKETEKAFLFQVLKKKNPNGFWVPKKLIKTKNDQIYVWQQFKPTYIEIKNEPF